MKINGMQRTYAEAPPVAKRAPQQSGPGPAARVAVSNEARALAEARSPHVSDAAKIQKLSEAIARGDFMIDASKVTDRMLAEER